MPMKRIPSARLDLAAEQFPALVDRGSPLLLQSLAETLGCCWAVFWSFYAGVFTPAVFWTAPVLSLRGLDPRAQKPATGGPCGSVWLHAGPRWSRDADADACMPRSPQADAAGLKSGLWLALGAAPKIAGVVELRARKLDRVDHRDMLLLERFGRGLTART